MEGYHNDSMKIESKKIYSALVKIVGKENIPAEFIDVYLKCNLENVHRSTCCLLDDGNEEDEILICEGYNVIEKKGTSFENYFPDLADSLGVDELTLIPLATFASDPGAQWIFITKAFEKNNSCPVYYVSDSKPQKISSSLSKWIASLSNQSAKKTLPKKLTKASQEAVQSKPPEYSFPKIPAADQPLVLESGFKYYIWGSDTGSKWLEAESWSNSRLKPVKGKLDEKGRTELIAALREGRSVKSIWKYFEAKMHRGTGHWLDCFLFSAADLYLPVVSVRMKEIIQKFDPEGVEFLPLRYKISENKKGDFFVLNPTLILDCLDKKAAGFPENPHFVETYPDAINCYEPKLILDHSLTNNALIFRPKWMLKVICIHESIAHELAKARLSGLLLTVPSNYPSCLWGGNGSKVFGR